MIPVRSPPNQEHQRLPITRAKRGNIERASMARTKNTENLSAVDAARKDLEAVEASASALAIELEALRAEHRILAAEREAGSLTVDYERLAELEDRAIPVREARLGDLADRLVPAARQRVNMQELARWADATAEGNLPAQLEAMRATCLEAEAVIAAEVAKIRQAVEGWNASVNSAKAEAKDAGLILGECDPLARVQVAYPDRNSGRFATNTLLVDGEEFTAFSVDASIDAYIRDAKAEAVAR